MEKTIKIPKGYEARIEGNEVIFELKESEDERIRTRLVEYFNGYYDRFSSRNNVNVHWEGLEVKAVIAYLEKQKDILGERAKNITASMLEDGIEGIQRELIEFLSNTVNASWVDIIQSADAYAERIRNIIEKQKEQQPAEWSKEDELNLYNTIEAIKYSFDVSEGSGGLRLINWLKYRLRLQNII